MVGPVGLVPSASLRDQRKRYPISASLRQTHFVGSHPYVRFAAKQHLFEVVGPVGFEPTTKGL